MPTTDEFLTALIAQGKKLKKKRGRPRKAKPSMTTHGKMDTGQPQRIRPGSFETKAVIASYLKRYCVQCGHSEIASIPRIFVLKQNKHKSSTRIYTRIETKKELEELLLHLPLKTVLYPEPSPGCKHCLQETDAHAKSKERQRENRGEDRQGSSGEAEVVSLGDIRTESTGDQVQARRTEPVHNSPDQPRLVRAGETFGGSQCLR